jgi:hypothetical protein
VRLAEQHQARHRVESFYQEISFWLRECMKEGPLPKPFEVCTKFEPDPEDNAEPDEWRLDHHYGCQHCHERIRLIGTTKSALYERYHERWRLLHPEQEHVDPKHVVSRAPPAEDDAPLSYACADFGHHAGGVGLFSVDLSEAETYMPSYLSDRVLFFFQHVQALHEISLSLNTTLATRRLAEKKAWAESEARRIEERKREHQREIEEFLALFREQP